MGVICFSAQKGRYNMTYSSLFRLYRRFYWRHQCAFHLVWVPPIIRWITYTYHSYFKEIPKSPQRSWQTSAPLITWWRHKMETFSAFSPFCEGNPPVTRGFRSQRPVTRSCDVFCDLRMNKRLDKQSRRRWFETPSLSLWRHFNAADAAHEICNMYIHGKLYSASLFSKRWYISLKTRSCNIWAWIHTITLIVFRCVWQITRRYNYLNINLVSGKLTRPNGKMSYLLVKRSRLRNREFAMNMDSEIDTVPNTSENYLCGNILRQWNKKQHSLKCNLLSIRKCVDKYITKS